MNEQLKRLVAINGQIRNIGMRIVESDPWVLMRVGGNDYKFELSMGAALEIFQKTGVALNFEQLLTSEIKDMRIFPVLMLAGLRTHYSDEFAENSERALMDMLSPRHFLYYVNCIQLAIQATEPDPIEMRAAMDEVQEISEEMNRPLAPASTSPGSGQDVPILVSPMPVSGE